MKKWLAFLLVMFFAFTLVGCKKTNQGGKKRPGQVSQKEIEEFWNEERPDFGGITINIMAAGHALYEHNPFDTEYAATDKEAKQQAWSKVEEKFNIKLEVIAYDEAAPWGPQRIAHINDMVRKGTPGAHFYTIASEWIPEFVQANSIINLESAYSSSGRAFMNVGVKQALSYKGELFALSNDNAGIDSGLFYNYKLLKELGVESPAEIFNRGEWTYSKFVDYVKDVQNKLPSVLPNDVQGYAIAGEPVYLWSGMVNAAGVKIMDVDSLILNIENPVAYEAINALRQIGEAGAVDPKGGYDATNESFRAGNALFSHGGLWFINADNRWKDVWGKDSTEFGFVPYPYPDNGEKDKVRTSYPGSQSYVIPRGLSLPAGITEEDLLKVMTDLYVGTSMYVKSDPNYDEDVAKRAAFERLVDDPASVDAMLYLIDGRVFFDPFEATAPHYNTGMGSAIRTLVLQGGDYNEKITPLINGIREKLIFSWG